MAIKRHIGLLPVVNEQDNPIGVVRLGDLHSLRVLVRDRHPAKMVGAGLRRGFGGNGTIIGSTANIVVASLSERTRAPITSKLWNQRGLPVILLTCTVASIFSIILFPLFSR